MTKNRRPTPSFPLVKAPASSAPGAIVFPGDISSPVWTASPGAATITIPATHTGAPASSTITIYSCSSIYVQKGLEQEDPYCLGEYSTRQTNLNLEIKWFDFGPFSPGSLVFKRHQSPYWHMSTTTTTINLTGAGLAPNNLFPPSPGQPTYVVPQGGTFFVPVLYGDLLLCVGKPFLPKQEEEEQEKLNDLRYAGSSNYYNSTSTTFLLPPQSRADRRPSPPEGVGPVMFQKFWNLKTNQMEELYLGGYTQGLLENFDPEGSHAGWQGPGTEQDNAR